jgi:hypothetical protein
MNRFFKTAILSVAVAATTLATLPAANAGDRYWRHRHYDRHYSNGGAVTGTTIALIPTAAIFWQPASSALPLALWSSVSPRSQSRSTGARLAFIAIPPMSTTMPMPVIWSRGAPNGTITAPTATAASTRGPAPSSVMTARSISASPTDRFSQKSIQRRGPRGSRRKCIRGMRETSSLPALRRGTDWCGALLRSDRPVHGRR